MNEKKLPGILLAAYGATAESGRQALLSFTGTVESAFPGHMVRWAFTARNPSRRPSLNGEPGSSVEDALSLLAARNHTHIAVQPLHLVGGYEHETLCRQTAVWQIAHRDVAVSVGPPLLKDTDAIQTVLRTMQAMEPGLLEPGEAAVWVGHGSERLHDDAYRRLAELGDMADPPLRIGFLSGGRGVEGCIPALKAAGETNICLVPFFALAGNHAVHDLGGDAPDSWSSRLKAAGFGCRIHLHGMLEYGDFAGMWLARLKEAVENLRGRPR